MFIPLFRSSLFLVSCSRNYRLNAFALSVLFDIFIRWPAHLVEVAEATDDDNDDASSI